MIRLLAVGAALLAAAGIVQDPAPRRLIPVDVRLPDGFETVSGARELRDGKLLVSDGKHAAVFVIDPASHAATRLSSPGGDSTQYAQPGGFYAGLADSTFLLDRGLARFLVISPSAKVIGSRSIKQRGISSSNDADIDFQRVDAHGFAYFTTMPRPGHVAVGARLTDSSTLVRFDAVKQRADTIGRLRLRESHVTQALENMTMTQEVIGSPADDWGIASDGRVAIVRASPYRVEWHGPGVTVVRGPEIAVDSIPYTTAEKDAFASSTARGSTASVGMQGGPSTTAKNARIFAPAKPPFVPHDVIVSPEGRVWVARMRAAGATTTLYDVFDARGERVDRVELPALTRVIGFGKNSVYAVERDAKGVASLRKYKLS